MGQLVNQNRGQQQQSYLMPNYMVLEGTDIYFFENETRGRMRFMYTLPGCFVKKHSEPYVENFQVFDCIQLVVNQKLGKTLFLKRGKAEQDD